MIVVLVFVIERDVCVPVQFGPVRVRWGCVYLCVCVRLRRRLGTSGMGG